MAKMKLIACHTLEEELLRVAPPDLEMVFLEYALHNTPGRLREELQREFDNDTENDTILLGYGLCSNSVLGVSSPRHRLVIPRVHDCISLLLGSRQKYDTEFKALPATIYLSKGWVKQKGDPYTAFLKYRERYGEEMARETTAMMYGNYQRVTYIHTLGNDDADMAFSRKVADFLDIDFAELNGNLDLFRALVSGNWDDRFLIVEPGESFTQMAFLR